MLEKYIAQGAGSKEFGTSLIDSYVKGRQIRAANQQEQKDQHLGQLTPQVMAGNTAALNEMIAKDPERAKGVLGLYQAQQKQAGELAKARQAEERDLAARGAFDILNAPQEQKQRVYGQLREALIAKGFETPEEMPTQYTPDMEYQLKQMLRGGQEISDFAAPEEKTEAIKTLEALQQDPTLAALDASRRKSSATNVNVNTEGARAKQSEVRRGKLIDNIFTQAESAKEIGVNVKSMKSSLDNLVQGGGVTGPASGMLSTLNELGGQLGLDVDLSESSSIRQIEGASNKIAVPLVKQLGVNPTDKDFEIIKSTVARAGTSVPANYAFLDTTNQLSDRKVAEEEIALRAIDEGMGETDIRRAINSYRDNNPISVPVSLPNNISQLKEGKRYATDKGVFTFDGENMVRVY